MLYLVFVFSMEMSKILGQGVRAALLYQGATVSQQHSVFCDLYLIFCILYDCMTKIMGQGKGG